MSSLPEYCLIINGAAAFYLTGLIWMVQRVHYPAFHHVALPGFPEFEAFHQRQITPVVAPAMLIELASSLFLLYMRPAAVPFWAAVLGAGLVAIIWLSTFLIQVPLHGRLSHSPTPEIMDSLVRSNWIRTVAWTIRAALLAWLILRVLQQT